MKYFICDNCSKTLPENETQLHAYPEWYNQPKMIKWAEDLRKKRKQEPEPEQRYHKAHEYARGGSKIFLCGPMHEETEQEYFIRWCYGKK